MLENAGSYRDYSFIGAAGSHHEISHHMDNPDNFAKLEIIDRWEMARFAKLLQKLKASPEGEGTLLLRLGGTCHGCAASSVTLKQGIEARLREMVPEVRHVQAV